jgi:hypothetical protein
MPLVRTDRGFAMVIGGFVLAVLVIVVVIVSRRD